MKKAILIYALKVLTPTAIAAFIWWCSAEPFSRGGTLAGVAAIVLLVSVIVAVNTYDDHIGKEQRTLHQRLYTAEFELRGATRNRDELRRECEGLQRDCEEINRGLLAKHAQICDLTRALAGVKTELATANETIKELEQKS